MTDLAERIRGAIRQIPDFPKPGICFYDITTLLKQGQLFSEVINALADRYRPFLGEEGNRISAIVGIESRGFILGAALAEVLRIGFIPVRKFGKLPAAVARASYSLEYGTDSVEIHRDALSPFDRVVVVDDLLATGGTAQAAGQLVQELGATVHEFLFLIELSELNGRALLGSAPAYSLVTY